MIYTSPEERDHLAGVLRGNIRREHERLAELLERASGVMGHERLVLKFYSGSFKVYSWQEETLRIVEALAGIAPEGRAFCEEFRQIIATGTGKDFTRAANEDWVRQVGPIVQAFLHARFFLEMAVKCVAPFEGIPAQVRWLALLELYGIR